MILFSPFSFAGKIISYLHCFCNADEGDKITHNISNTFALRGDFVLSNFKIPSIPPTTNKTIRFPNDLVAGIENAIKGRDCTFSAFVISAVRAALEEIAEEK